MGHQGPSAPESQEPRSTDGSRKPPLPVVSIDSQSIPPALKPADDAKPGFTRLVAPAVAALDLSSNGIKVAATEARLTVDDSSDPYHRPSGDRPSPYLQSLCPLCFGAAFAAVKELLGGLPDATL